MGLEERRMMKAAQDGWLPKKQAELKELCAGDVVYEIDWSTFEGDPKGLNWLEFNGPQQVSNAFRIVGNDDLGKGALRGIRKIVVRNVPESEKKELSYTEGVLGLTCAFAKSPAGRFTPQEIADYLLKSL